MSKRRKKRSQKRRKNPARRRRRRSAATAAAPRRHRHNPRRSHKRRRRHNPAHRAAPRRHHRRHRRHKRNPAFSFDVALAPVAGLAVNLAARLAPTLFSSSFNPWFRRGIGGVASAAGVALSMFSPRIGAAIATAGLDAAVGDDLALAIAPHLPHPKPAPAAVGAMSSDRDAYARLNPNGLGITRDTDNPDAIGALIGEYTDDADDIGALIG